MVSQPDRPRGRGRKLSPSPVAARAIDAGWPLLRPERVADEACVSALRETAPDVGVVVAFGQFITKQVRELPGRGYMINAHASLLPRYRGASPIAQSILHGDAETGISVMRVDKEMDAGPVANVKRTRIDPMENADELGRRLSVLAGEALLETLDAIEDDRVVWTEQDHALATHAPKLDKQDGWIDWRRPAAELVHHVHGHAPRPGAFGELVSAGESRTLRVLRARAVDAPDDAPPEAEPGAVHRPAGPDAPVLVVATGRGWLAPLEVQRAGGKAMAIDAFLRGQPLAPNAHFDTARPPTHAPPRGASR